MARYEVTFETRFSAKHALRHYRGRTEPPHRHCFRVAVIVSAARLDRSGMAIDFLDLEKAVSAEVARLRGRYLNAEVPEFLAGRRSPSAENMAAVIFRRLEKALPKAVRLERVTIGEARGCSAACVR